MVIRLINSNPNSTGAQYSGRLELFYNNAWGTVCISQWDHYDTIVACKMLGFATAEQYYNANNTGTGKRSLSSSLTSIINCYFLPGPIAFTNFGCTGTESSLFNCSHSSYGSTGSCSHANDVGIICSDS